MSLLTKAYNSENAPSVATIMVSIGTALLFSVGVFLIMNAQFGKQANQLESAQNSITKLAENRNGEFDTITVEEEATLNGTLTVAGETTLEGDTNIEGDTTLGGDLEVSGKGDIRTLLAVDGDTTFGETIAVLGKTELKGDLDVTGAATLQAAISVTGDTSLGEGVTVAGQASFGGDFDVAGGLQLKSGLTVGGDSSFDATGGTFTLQGVAAFGGDFSVAGTSVLQQSLSVTGAESTTSFDGTGSTSNGTTTSTILLGTGPSLQVAGATTLQGDMNVNGTTLLGSTLSVIAANATETPTSSFDATGSTTNGSTSSTILLGSGPSFQVTGATTLQGDLSVAGTALFQTLQQTALTNCTVSATVECQPFIEFDGTGTNAGNTILLGTGASFAVTGAAQLQGSLDVSGTASFGSLIQTSIPQLQCNTTVDIYCTPEIEIDATGFAGISLVVTGAGAFQGDFKVVGTASFGTTLTQTAIANCTTIVDINCTPDIVIDATGFTGTSLAVAGAVGLQGDFTVDGTASFGSTLNVTGGMTIDGSLDVNTTVVGMTTVLGIVSADAGYQVSTFTGIGIYDDGAPGGPEDCTGAYLRGMNVHGGIVTSGACSGVGDSRTETGCGGGNDFHLRITAIDAGIVTAVECARDDGDIYGQFGTPDPNAGTFYDLAEKFVSTQTLEAGDVVRIDPSNPEQVLKSISTNDSSAIGVVSTAPGYTLGSGGSGYPIALAGRVPVKVTNEGGAIAPGDYLTTSSTSGHAKKASVTDKTIGQALAGFDGAAGTVMMFVNVSRGAVDPNSTLQSAAPSSQLTSASFTSLNVSGPSILNDLQVIGTATIENLQVIGSTTVVKLIVNGHIVGNNDTRGTITIPAGATTAHIDFATPYDGEPAIVASPVGQSVLYSVASTTTGFDITTPNTASTDIKFNYLVQQ